MNFLIYVLFILNLNASELNSEKVVSKFKIPWKGDYKLIGTLPSNWDDPGKINKIEVYKNGSKILKLNDLTVIKGSENINYPKKSKRIDDYFKLVSLGKGTNVIVFYNWVGGSSPDSLNMIGKDLKGNPYFVFSKPYFIKSLTDYDKDGLVDILTESVRESVEKDKFCYSPFLVLKQTRNKNKISFEIDVDLSEKYTKENAMEWFGTKNDCEIIVDKNGNRLMN